MVERSPVTLSDWPTNKPRERGVGVDGDDQGGAASKHPRFPIEF